MNISIKTYFVILFFLFAFHFSNGQHSNVILFTENGEKFSVVLNGVVQNSTPETNVKIIDLPAPTYKLKIIFEDKQCGSIDKTLTLGKDLEMTYCIKKNNKDQFVVRFQNQVDILHASAPTSAQRVIEYSTSPEPGNLTVTNNQTTNSTVTNVNAQGGIVNISINSEVKSGEPVEKHELYHMPGYNGRIGCPYPITDLDFENVKQNISEKSFEESKLKIAKQVTSSNCLFASEVKEIMDLFSFEKSKVDFAKFAYKYTYDVSNYYKVNDAFSFESSINELAEYIQRLNDN
jgi:hypothetical protein